MYIIGVDFSIQYPAACVSRDFKEFSFLAVANDPNASGLATDFVNCACADHRDMSVVRHTRPARVGDAYYESERTKLVHYSGLVTRFVSGIKAAVGGSRDVVLAMEGVSYGSKGSSLVDISIATGMFRDRALGEVLGWDASRFFVFSPSELKQSIGEKGNADKVAIFEAFLRDPLIGEVGSSGFYEFLAGNRGSERVYNPKTDRVCSPWNDMVDSYLCVLHMWNVLRKKNDE